jgi:anti-sigma-K factor RskA
MNIPNYIASGVLELYVNGLLSEPEKREVEALAAQYPEIREEINRIEEALEAYAMAHRQAPKRNLKQAILDKIDLEENKDKPSAKVVQMTGFQRYAIAAAVIGLLFSGALNLILYRNLTASQDEVTALMSEKSTVVENNNVLKASYEEKINTLAAPNTKVVALAGLPLAPNSKIKVYWNDKNQQTYLRIENLPAAPSDKQYQLWALADGKPIDAGVFDSAEGVLQQMKSIGAAQAFAITLEQKGGSPTPTMEQMYAMGKI